MLINPFTDSTIDAMSRIVISIVSLHFFLVNLTKHKSNQLLMFMHVWILSIVIAMIERKARRRSQLFTFVNNIKAKIFLEISICNVCCCHRLPLSICVLLAFDYNSSHLSFACVISVSFYGVYLNLNFVTSVFIFK